MIKAIAFDLGGVFATNAPRHLIREIALKENKEIDQVLKAWNRYWTGFIIGDLTEDQFFESLVRELHIEGHRRETIEEFKEYARTFIALDSETYDKAIELYSVLSKANRRLKFALISNNTREWWDYLTSDHDLSLFTTVINSFDHRLPKPNEKLFEILADQLKIKPEEVIVIDDKSSNVDAAMRVGMSAHKYENWDTLIEVLHDLKILDDNSYKKLTEKEDQEK